METLYDTLLALCARDNITGYRMCQDLGLSRGMMTDLKMGRKKSLSAGTLQKLAGYFSIPVDELLGQSAEPAQEPGSPLVNQDEELTDYLEELRTRPELKTLFSLTRGATKADVEKAVRIVEALLAQEP